MPGGASARVGPRHPPDDRAPWRRKTSPAAAGDAAMTPPKPGAGLRPPRLDCAGTRCCVGRQTPPHGDHAGAFAVCGATTAIPEERGETAGFPARLRPVPCATGTPPPTERPPTGAPLPNGADRRAVRRLRRPRPGAPSFQPFRRTILPIGQPVIHVRPSPRRAAVCPRHAVRALLRPERRENPRTGSRPSRAEGMPARGRATHRPNAERRRPGAGGAETRPYRPSDGALSICGCASAIRGCALFIRGCTLSIRGCMSAIRGCASAIHGCVSAVSPV